MNVFNTELIILSQILLMQNWTFQIIRYNIQEQSSSLVRKFRFQNLLSSSQPPYLSAECVITYGTVGWRISHLHNVRSYTRLHSVQFNCFSHSFVGLGLFFMLARHVALSFATSPCPLGESGMAFCIEWDPELSSPYAGAFGKHYRLYSRHYCPSFEALHPQTASTSLSVRIFFWALRPLQLYFHYQWNDIFEVAIINIIRSVLFGTSLL